MKKSVKYVGLAIVAGFLLTGAGCASDAQTVSENLSTAADQFEIQRKIVGINGITDKPLFSVEGFCSYEIEADAYDVICKQPDGSIERTTMAKANNVTMVVTQMGGKKVDLFRSRVIFRPETIVPNFDLSTR